MSESMIEVEVVHAAVDRQVPQQLHLAVGEFAAVALVEAQLAALLARRKTGEPVAPPRGRYFARFDGSRIAGTDEVRRRLGEAPGWLLDARAPERFRGEVEPLDPVAGHIPGALNRPFAAHQQDGRIKPAVVLREEFEALLHGRDPGDVLLSCGSGVTACHNLLAMEHAGLTGARVYAPSWSGWVADPANPVATGD